MDFQARASVNDGRSCRAVSSSEADRLPSGSLMHVIAVVVVTVQ